MKKVALIVPLNEAGIDLPGLEKHFAQEAGAPVRLVAIQGFGTKGELGRALEKCAGEDVVLLDPQVAVTSKGWLRKFLDLAERKPDAGIIGAKLLDPMGLIYSCGRNVVSPFGVCEFQANIGYGESDAASYGEAMEADSVNPSLVYIRREVIETVGGVDERWFGLGRSSWPGVCFDDFCLAARREGFSVWVEPLVVAVQSHTKTFQKLSEAKELVPLEEREVNYWRKKWRWHPEYPNLGKIREKWGGTKIAWRIGDVLRDEWEEEEPPVDVLMVTRNSRQFLEQMLKCLAETDYSSLRVLVLLNGSDDDSEVFLSGLKENYPFPLHIEKSPTNIGLPAGVNWLLSKVEAPLVARLDDDILFDPDWLKRLVADLRERPYAGVVGCKIVNREDPSKLLWADYRLWPRAWNHQEEEDTGAFDHLAPTIANMGCCLLFRATALRRVGLMDISLSPVSWEDLDYQLAFWAAGYEVLFDGRVAVRHPWKQLRDICKRTRGNMLGNGTKVHLKWGPGAFRAVDHGLDLAGRNGATGKAQA